ncbi:hypothetical protein QBC36DRAFT_62312 [Triangularia setosa]|uniref:F-box domain-containing protein n=1 Tax=Triangularia setosa TaxID=2587417 RepID=A0AAN6W0C1_9PEZI|nr:hypothetical protein QBC36DRAFT_62312 [Podospora setosa]
MQSQSTSQHPVPLERLPLHIAQYLLDFVDRRSISSFSLANKFCCQAAAPQRFVHLKLTIRDKEKLNHDLEQLNKSLTVDNRFLHVRRITLRGFLLCGTDHIGPNAVDGRFLANGGWNETPEDGDSEIEDVADLTYFAPDLPRYTAQRKQEQNKAWQPFADFLSQLSGLKDFVYACTHQIPPCVLRALHQYHPRSRLHMHTFSLRSLYQDRDSVHDIDLDELALVTSPCLYSIEMKYEPDSSHGQTSYNTEAIKWMVKNSASLRKVRLYYSHPGNSLALQRAIQMPRPCWKGFFRQDNPNTFVDEGVPETSEKYPLVSLIFRSEGFDTGLNHIGMWRRLRSFKHLRQLEISPCTSADVEQLVSLAANDEFCSLRELAVDFGDVNNNLGSILFALSHLETLKLSGEIDDGTYLGIHHSPRLTLRKLQIYPNESAPLTHSQVQKLVHWCPNLEDVRLRVKREQGGPNEVAMYRLLGRLPRLRRVVLQFACPTPYLPPSMRAMMDPSRDKVRDFRRALIEIAVDETLARAIFQKIAARKCPLERLKIESLPINNSITTSLPFANVWADIAGFVGGRSWLCTRDDVESGKAEVRDITKETMLREMILERLREPVDEDTKNLWAEVWPPREGGSENWWDNWWSYPLSDTHEDDGEVTRGAGPDIKMRTT